MNKTNPPFPIWRRDGYRKLRVETAVALLLVLNWNATAAPQSHSIDLNIPPKPLVTGHLDLGGAGPSGKSYAVNSYYIEKNGKPFMPVVGEFHFSRYPAAEWEMELRKMKGGGIDVVATYVFWNLHERKEGKFDWSGDLDLRRFVKTAGKVGLDVIVRLGPFDHGEIRNGGLPDWLYGREFETRSNDPLYLEYCNKLYAAIAGQVRGLLFKDGGPVIGVQLENEFQHSAAPWEIRYAGAPIEYTASEQDLKVTHKQVAESNVKNENVGYGRDHMSNLKIIAKKHGFDVPLYTATGWGNAAIVPKGSIPVTAAYPYPYWEEKVKPSTFYLFKDMHAVPDYSPVSYEPELYPSMPVELGVGMSEVYKARTFIPEDSIEPMMVRMLGSGANGLGYYMYHGGATPSFDGIFYNEDASGLPKIDYDYQAPLGKYGQVRSHYKSLRLLHLFMQSYGDKLALMATILPPKAKDLAPGDTENLRYAARGANGSGFLFLLNFQDHAQTRDLADLQLHVQDGKRTIAFPSQGTFTLKDGQSAILPVNLDLGGKVLRSAMVQPLTVLSHGGKNHYVFFSIDGLSAELVFDSGKVASAENCRVTAGDNEATIVTGTADKAFAFTIDGKPILVIPRAIALQAMLLPNGRLAFADATLLPDGSKLTVLSTGQTSATVNIYPAINDLAKASGAAVTQADSLISSMSAFQLNFQPVTYSAQWRKITDRRYAVRFDAGLGELNEVLMRVNFAGDSGMAFINGQMVDDHLYTGHPWQIGLKRFLPRLSVGKKEMVFVFHAMKRDSKVLADIPAEYQLNFAEDQKDYLKVNGVDFTPEYKATVELGKSVSNY